MQASISRILLGIMVGCLVMTSVANAQQLQSQPVFHNMPNGYGMAGQAQDYYVPYQQQAVYTNTSWQVVDPLAESEAAYSQWQGYGVAGNSPQFNGDQYAYGYQPTYGQPCAPSFRPGWTCGQWFVTGWLDQGVTFNWDKPKNKTNGPLRFTDRANEYQLRQLYLSMGRYVATSGCNLDFGGRVDMLYGSDYYYVSAIGLETHTTVNGQYQESQTALQSKWNRNNGPRGGIIEASRFGLAMPQLYAEMYVPIHLGLNVKAGHFYSIMGYESAMSPQNFFYTHTYSMMYGQPMTHTGFLFSQRLTQRLTGIFGVTRGWDTWEDPNGKLSYLAGIRWNSCDGRTEFSWVAGTGNETVEDRENADARSRPGAIRSHYSMVLSHQLTPRLKLVTQHDMGYEQDANFVVTGRRENYVDGHWYSISQYAFYQLTENLTFGVRGEWFRDVNASRICTHPYREVFQGTTLSQVEGTDYSNVTVGLNWKPYDRLIVRPEARWDWSGVHNTGTMYNTGGMYKDFTKKSQSTLSVSAIVTF